MKRLDQADGAPAYECVARAVAAVKAAAPLCGVDATRRALTAATTGRESAVAGAGRTRVCFWENGTPNGDREWLLFPWP